MMNDLLLALPLGIVVLMGCCVLVLDVFSKVEDTRYLGYLTAAGMLISVSLCYMFWGVEDSGFVTTYFSGMMAMGRFELLACALLALFGFFVALLASEQAHAEGYSNGEFYALLNFAVFGMMILVTASHLVTLFLGLEIMSIAVYVLAAIKRRSPYAVEAGMKYFILGAFATGLLVYGMAFLYGETAALDLNGIRTQLSSGEASGYLSLALLLLTAGFGFKIALVPFHMWTPDVYEGAPPPVTTLMATGVKAAAVLVFAKFYVLALPNAVLGDLSEPFVDVLGVLAILTMTFGNLVALSQRNLKRMLAYSSVAHAGYLLLGILAAHVGGTVNPAGLAPVLFYLFVYGIANIAAFGVIVFITTGRSEDVTHAHVSGLGRTHPLVALALAAAMFSLAGIPPMAGFFGKLTLFREVLVVDSDRFLWLVIIAVLNSVVSVYYYLKVVVHLYMREGAVESPALRSRTLIAAFVITLLLTIQVGVFPGRYLKMAGDAVRDLATTMIRPTQTAEARSVSGDEARVHDVLRVADTER
jgi:NADH-quinone oxidoreductase subunit N